MSCDSTLTAYDCNCQKVVAGFAACISVAMAIETWLVYQFRCFRSFRFGHTSFSANPIFGVDCESAVVAVKSDYWFASSGGGLICVTALAFLKVLDLCFNFAIPTPTICCDREGRCTELCR